MLNLRMLLVGHSGKNKYCLVWNYAYSKVPFKYDRVNPVSQIQSLLNWSFAPTIFNLPLIYKHSYIRSDSIFTVVTDTL